MKYIFQTYLLFFEIYISDLLNSSQLNTLLINYYSYYLNTIYMTILYMHLSLLKYFKNGILLWPN